MADSKNNGIFKYKEAGRMVGRIGGANGTQHVSAKVESTTPDGGVAVAEVQAVSVQNEQQSGEERQLPVEKAQQMTDSMNKFLESVNTQLRFKLHNELKEYYVTIVDSKTDEVVREIPSKKLMDIYAAMKEFVGLLIDRKI
jgi:flagellar protein FlaG